jgi:LysM repeat protein
MKILKIFGIVVGIHVFALILIFANPGCSSSTKPPPAPSDTASSPPPSIRVPDTSGPMPSSPAMASSSSAPSVSFNPDAPASGSSGTRYTPTRPGSPAATVVVAEPVADVTPATTYTVKSGDSLWTIAKKHHLTVAQLSAANSLPASTNLKPGQKLLIPGKPSSPTAAATANPAAAQGKTAETIAPRPSASSGGSVKHTVKAGETLGAIARTYGVKPGDIAVANNIVDPAKIRAGMELVIPG